jgi:ribose/xylose/arabinose/galactoside ABC-type transport system permease subunit
MGSHMDQDQGQCGSNVDALLDELESEAAEQVLARPAPRGAAGVLRAILRMRELSVLGATILLFVALSLATPLFPQLENVLLVARQISILAIIATSVTFLFISREIDLSVGSIYGFLGIVLALLIAKFSVNPWLAMVITVLLGAGIGLVNGLLTTRFGIPSFIVTLGTLSILRGGALLLSGGWPVLIKLERTDSFLNITAGHAVDVVPMQVFWMIGVMLIAGFVLSKTRFGSHVYATGGNEEAALLAGIRTKRVKVICFMMTGALCGVATTLLLGQVRSAFPLTGSGYELDIIAAVVIGGTPLFGGAGSILGTFLGAAVLGMITNGLVLLGASAYFEPVAKGLIIVAAILVDTVVRRRRV